VRLAALARLAHPFPSLLNALVTAAIASIAGAAPEVALRLGGSMLALQASIGALNDALDAGIDSGRKPGKPIPRGLATSTEATGIAVLALVAGLALSAPSGLPTLLVALAGVGCGYAYDVGLGRTALSWLPLVVALPLLPIHAWLGATGSLPPGLATLAPAAILAGASLAIANGIVDAERDLAGGRPTIVVRLGRSRAWLVHGALAVGLASVAVVGAPRGGTTPVLGGLAVGEIAIGLGLGLVAVGAAVLRRPEAGLRERGWELEAIGVGLVGVGWLVGSAGLDR
jgi:4-hydroxybenzoate polyprenyltransferase